MRLPISLCLAGVAIHLRSDLPRHRRRQDLGWKFPGWRRQHNSCCSERRRRAVLGTSCTPRWSIRRHPFRKWYSFACQPLLAGRGTLRLRRCRWRCWRGTPLAPRRRREVLLVRWRCWSGSRRRSTNRSCCRGAIADCNQALKLEPEQAGACCVRGQAKCALGDHEGAIADCNQALKLEPEYAEAFYVRGQAKGALGDHEGAIADFTQALKLKPEHAGAPNSRHGVSMSVTISWYVSKNTCFSWIQSTRALAVAAPVALAVAAPVASPAAFGNHPKMWYTSLINRDAALPWRTQMRKKYHQRSSLETDRCIVMLRMSSAHVKG